MKMKFQIIYIALAVLSLSCSKSDMGVINKNLKRNITFAQKQTKGTMLGSSSMLPSMDVIIYETDPNAPALAEEDVVMYNPISPLELNSADNSWSHSPALAWPVNESQELTFLAVSPSMPLADNPLYVKESIYYDEGMIPDYPAAITNFSENGLVYLPSGDNNYYEIYADLYDYTPEVISDKFLTVYYKVPENVTNHPDLVFASASDSYTSAEESVNLSFIHALTAVSFSVMGDSNQKVTSIKLIDVNTEAYMFYASEFDEGAYYGGSSYMVQDYMEWFTLNSRDVIAPIINDVVPNRLSATSLTPEGGILMMIPAESWDVRNYSVEVTYEHDGLTKIQTLLFPSYHEWDSGIHNNYTISLPEDLGPMSIIVTATEWNDIEYELDTEDWGPGTEGEVEA